MVHGFLFGALAGAAVRDYTRRRQDNQYALQQSLVTNMAPIAGMETCINAVDENEWKADKLQIRAKFHFKNLAISQIIFGGIALLAAVCVLIFSEGVHKDVTYNSIASVAAVFHIVCGGIGLGTIKANTKRWIIASLVLNILCCAGWSVVIVGITSSRINIAQKRGCSVSLMYYDCYGRDVYVNDSLMMFMTFAQVVVTIWSAVLCCGGICMCCKSPPQKPDVSYVQTAVPVASYPTVQPSVVHTQYMYPQAPVAQQPAPPAYYVHQ